MDDYSGEEETGEFTAEVGCFPSGLCWDGPAGNTVFAFVRLIYGNLNWCFLC